MGEQREKEVKRDKKDKSHHRDKSEHKDRSKDRDRDRDRERDRHRSKDKPRDKDHSSHRHSREAPPTEAVNPEAAALADTQPKTEQKAPEEARQLDSRSPHKRDRDEALELPSTRSDDPPADRHKRQRVSESAPIDAPLPAPPAQQQQQPQQQQEWVVQENGQESSMSIEDTNRLRASLGLKPLSANNKRAEADKALQAAADAKRREEQKQAEADRIAARVKAAKEKREAEEKLRGVKGLGEADQQGDDLMSWVDKSRKLEEERAKAERTAKLLQQQEQGDDDSDEEAMTSAAELAGLRVKHGAAEVNEGETMILTMADRNILDDKGDIDEAAGELENVLMAEQKRREKARKDATNQGKPLFDEDGQRKGILDKYDEDEEAEGMEIDTHGAAAGKLTKQEEIRRKLAAAQERVQASVPATMAGSKDFYTPEEMAKPKQRKKRKMRKREAADEADELAAAGLDIAALEAAAAAAEGTQDHGSRRGAADRAAKAEAERAAEKQRRQERYDAALQKANYASLAMQQNGAGGADEGEGEEDDLQESLARARRAAQRDAGASGEAAEAALRRRDTAGGVAAGLIGTSGMSFTETGEFARGINLPVGEDNKSVVKKLEEAKEEEPEAMDADSPLPPTPGPKAKSEQRGGKWVSTEGADDEDGDVDMEAVVAEAVKQEPQEADTQEQPITREKRIGGGLGGALSLLRERGELNKPVEWAGRTNDMRSDKLAQLSDIYTGGRHDREMDSHIEAALTKRDEFGRVMTPKEAFRALCYKFHGKDPSKNKKEKRIQRYQEDQKVKQAAASVQPASSSDRLAAAAQASATPGLTLTGGKNLGNKAREEPVALTPMLRGGDTPLVGDKKVAAMLGIRKGEESMRPPASRSVRK